MKIKLIKTISLVLFLCGLAAANAFAATVTVTKSEDTADGICDADCSLREAAVAANNGDVVVFSPLFNSPQTITLTGGQITIDKNLTVAGTGANLLSVSGNNANRIFYISGNAVVALSGMKLTGGRQTTSADPNGGAIYLTDSTLTLINMMLSGNKARFTSQPTPPQQPQSRGAGGAVYSKNSALAIINSLINTNDASNGSGIASTNGVVNVVSSVFNGNIDRSVISSDGIISVVSSSITNNSGGIGNGGILTVDRSIISNNCCFGGVGNSGSAAISKTTLDKNKNIINGGGVFNSGGMSIKDSTISSNESDRSGGGIYNAGQLTVTNSTVSGNLLLIDPGLTGNSSGGGIYNTSTGSLILTNATIANNHAKGLGGGVHQDSTGAVTIRNTIIAGNSSSTSEIDVSGKIVSQGFNLIGNTTGSSGWINSDLLNRNPLLALLGNYGGLTLTHSLTSGSPAINAGSNALAVDPATNNTLQYDQRGVDYRRAIGGGIGIVDIGAYESNIPASPVTLSGRVLTSDGRGVSNARITLMDSNGTIIYAQTSSFGYYRFVNVPPGTTYTITVSSKRYQFNSPQVVRIDRDRSDLNFVASLQYRNFI
jgi:CSLREA domain-containing protein